MQVDTTLTMGILIRGTTLDTTLDMSSLGMCTLDMGTNTMDTGHLMDITSTMDTGRLMDTTSTMDIGHLMDTIDTMNTTNTV